MKIVDPDIRASLPLNQPDEICIRVTKSRKVSKVSNIEDRTSKFLNFFTILTEINSISYLIDPEATKIMIVNGWLHTGDIEFMFLFSIERLGVISQDRDFNTSVQNFKSSTKIGLLHLQSSHVMKESGSFENSYIPENPRTPKPLTFSKNRLWGAKNRSNTSPSHIYKKKKLHICIKIIFFRKFFSANYNDYKRFEGSQSRVFERNNGLGDIGNWGKSRSFENSYIPENPRTPKQLTFSKNRLRGAKNCSNISPVAKKNFRKNDFFFFPKTLHMCQLFLCAYVHSFLFCFKTAQKHEMSLYNTYLKSCTYAQKIKKSCTYAKVKKKYHFSGNFFQRIVMINNVLEGSEVGFLKGITVWEI
ncbi:hypothetical protein LXL04_020357 [Taraxacum kok-saghyz]